MDNFGVNGQVDVGVKVWENDSGTASIGIGGSYSQGAGRYGGNSYETQPHWSGGIGAQFEW